MWKYDTARCRIIEKKEPQPGIFDFIVDAPQFAETAQPGQFAHVYVPGHTLRRPISICQADAQRGALRLVFQVRGEGTEQLAKMRMGDDLDVLAPLGNGFPLLPKSKKALLFGGGIGVPPLLGVAEHYGKDATVCLGFKGAQQVILQEDFERSGASVKVSTDDGAYGVHGNALDAAKGETADVIYACGPTQMLKAISKRAQEMGALCYVSLEERMACGVGACLGCACGLINERNELYYGHVCKDGPVFNSSSIADFASFSAQCDTNS